MFCKHYCLFYCSLNCKCIRIFVMLSIAKTCLDPIMIPHVIDKSLLQKELICKKTYEMLYRFRCNISCHLYYNLFHQMYFYKSYNNETNRKYYVKQKERSIFDNEKVLFIFIFCVTNLGSF